MNNMYFGGKQPHINNGWGYECKSPKKIGFATKLEFGLPGLWFGDILDGEEESKLGTNDMCGLDMDSGWYGDGLDDLNLEGLNESELEFGDFDFEAPGVFEESGNDSLGTAFKVVNESPFRDTNTAIEYLRAYGIDVKPEYVNENLGKIQVMVTDLVNKLNN